MKKIFAIIFIFFVAAATKVFAADNLLHSITLEKSNTGYNIILDTDSKADVTKKIRSEDELVINLKNVTSSETVNAIYKGTNAIDGLVIENVAPANLKINIKAENIKNSTVMITTPDGNASIVGESVPLEKVLWILFVVSLFAVIRKISKDIAEDDDKIIIKKDIKNREIQMYRRYRNELSSNMSINSLNNTIKKIDRKIDERLTASVR